MRINRLTQQDRTVQVIVTKSQGVTKKPIIPLGGYTLPSSLWHSWGGRNCDFLYIFGIVGDLSWGHLGHIIRYAFEWTGTECHGILRYGKISRVLFVCCLSETPTISYLQQHQSSCGFLPFSLVLRKGEYLFIVVGQPLKSSVTWIIPKGGYLNSHILNCTIIVSTVKYRGYSILST